MRSTAVLLLLAATALPACVDSPDDEAEAADEFSGTWEISRTVTETRCARDFVPRADVRMLIAGNAADGYTATEGFGSTQAVGADLVVVDGMTRLNVNIQEYWPGLGSQPDAAPGVFFTLWPAGDGLAGTSRAIASYSVDSELVRCEFDFTLTATRVAP